MRARFRPANKNLDQPQIKTYLVSRPNEARAQLRSREIRSTQIALLVTRPSYCQPRQSLVLPAQRTKPKKHNFRLPGLQREVGRQLRPMQGAAPPRQCRRRKCTSRDTCVTKICQGPGIAQPGRKFKRGNTIYQKRSPTTTSPNGPKTSFAKLMNPF